MRGVGLKALSAIVIALALQIPLLMIGSIITERGARQLQVEHEIASSWTGRQRLVVPVLQADYEVVYDERVWNPEYNRFQTVQRRRWATAHLLAETALANIEVTTSRRSRGLFSVPVYSATINVEGVFATSRFDDYASGIDNFSRWADTATLNVAVDDPRGIARLPVLHWNGATLSTLSGSRFDAFAQAPASPGPAHMRREVAPPNDVPSPGGTGGVHATVPLLLQGDTELEYRLDLDLRGSRALELLPLARETRTTMQASWPHPKFSGAFLPARHDIRDDGFTATWQTSVFASNVDTLLSRCGAGECRGLVSRARAVEFVDPVDIYSKTQRAVKYGLIFIVLTFAGLFASDVFGSRAIHPLQYAFTGFAVGIFFLLLLALSEHTGFGSAYLLATAACASLIGAYAAGATRRGMLGAAFSVCVAALYGTLYLVLLAEDFALLAGSLLLFAALALIMLATRRLDWYSVTRSR